MDLGHVKSRSYSDAMYAIVRHREYTISVAVAGVIVAFLLLPSAAVAEESDKPDILLIMPDQMRGDCLSILNHPAVSTPQIDDIAKQGVLFRRAYATVPSCIPARYGMLTGLYPQTSGVVGFKAKPFSTPPFPELLSRGGYTTVLVGRNMHQHPASGSSGYQRRVLGSTYINDDAYGKFLRKAVPETGGILALIEKMGVTLNYWQAKSWPLADELHPNEWIVAQSHKVIEEVDTSQPLFLTTSFYAPHPPLFPPKRYFDNYLNENLPPVAHGDWVNWESLSPEGDKVGQRVLLQGEVLRDAQAGYFGLIEHIDNQIGTLIRDFKARSKNAGRPWVIIFTSDHGEMLGDHGYFRKCEPYEGSANVPLVINGSPELEFEANLQIKQPVCLEDIMPTLLTLARIECPKHVDGINLVPALRGKQQTIREWLHFEHAPIYSKAQAFHALTDGTYKYIWRPEDGREQLFNLDDDPQEERDLSDDASHHSTLAEWRTRLVQRLAERPEGFSVDGKLMPGRPYPPLNTGTMSARRVEQNSEWQAEGMQSKPYTAAR
jgi:arylsulfatase